MKIYSPIKWGRNWRSGWFHELKNKTDLAWTISQSFGENVLGINYYEKYGMVGHNGIDFTFNEGTEVLAAHDGRVTLTIDGSIDKGYGYYIELSDSIQRIKTVYAHLQKNLVKIDDEVKAGQVIALGDSTGDSTGHHLHFTLKEIDQLGNTTNQDNGYFGAIDPWPFIVWFDNMTEKEVAQLQALEGYSDEAGITFWTGKPLSDYLKARLADKIKALQNAQ